MKRFFTFILTVLCLFSLTGCNFENVVLPETKSFEVVGSVSVLDLQVNAGEITIEKSDAFSVESNLKYLSVAADESGVLKIVDNAKSTSRYNGAKLKLVIPNGVTFETVTIKTGAGNVVVDEISTNHLSLMLGAGNMNANALNSYVSTSIKGGAGELSIFGGTLSNLSLEMGVGELNLTSALNGANNLKLGVGESNVNLIGGADSYKIETLNGIGSITVNGNSVSSSTTIGSGKNTVKIEGGVGAIKVTFP